MNNNLLFLTVLIPLLLIAPSLVMAQNDTAQFHSKTLSKLLTHERFEKCWEKEKSITGIQGDTIDSIKPHMEKKLIAGNITDGPPDYTPNPFDVDIEDCMLGINH